MQKHRKKKNLAGYIMDNLFKGFQSKNSFFNFHDFLNF